MLIGGSNDFSYAVSIRDILFRHLNLNILVWGEGVRSFKLKFFYLWVVFPIFLCSPPRCVNSPKCAGTSQTRLQILPHAHFLLRTFRHGT